jgi:hypothetical protein
VWTDDTPGPLLRLAIALGGKTGKAIYEITPDEIRPIEATSSASRAPSRSWTCPTSSAKP